MRTLVTLLGVVAILTGALWIGQGLGYVHWPKTSFMINETVWAYRGAGLAFIGLLLVFFARRRG